MKSDPDKVTAFLERLKLKPVITPTSKPKVELAPQRARRARPLVMSMDGWQIAGNVVIMPDGSLDALEKLLAPRRNSDGSAPCDSA